MLCELPQTFKVVVEVNEIDETINKKKEKKFFFENFRLTVLQDALWAL